MWTVDANGQANGRVSALKNELLAAFDDSYLATLKNEYTSYTTSSTTELIDHLYKHCARISLTNMEENDKRLRASYNAEEPLKAKWVCGLHNRSQKASLGDAASPHCIRTGGRDSKITRRLQVLEEPGQQILDKLPGPFHWGAGRLQREEENLTLGRLRSQQPGRHWGSLRQPCSGNGRRQGGSD